MRTWLGGKYGGRRLVGWLIGNASRSVHSENSASEKTKRERERRRESQGEKESRSLSRVARGTGLMFRSFKTRIGRNFLSITKLLFIAFIYYLPSVLFPLFHLSNLVSRIQTASILSIHGESNFPLCEGNERSRSNQKRTSGVFLRGVTPNDDRS